MYVPEEKYFLELDKYVSSNTLLSPLVVSGDAGMGKSALLANWASTITDHHPEFITVTHHICASPSSTSYISMLRRILLVYMVKYLVIICSGATVTNRRYYRVYSKG